MNLKTVKIIIFSALFLTTSCEQKPAPYIDKSNIIFSKSGSRNVHEQIKNKHSENMQDAFNEAPQEQEIIETKLGALDSDKPTKEIETSQALDNNDSNKLTDMDLEKQIDAKKKDPEASNQVVASSGSSYKTPSPLNSQKFEWPVEGKVLSHYGKTGNKFNEGINIAAPLGSPVSAASDGKVVYIGNNVEGYGNLLIIKHDGDIMTAYAHLKDIVVERGAQVKRGESIGSVGQVGNVREPQLHFSIRKGKKTIDPEKSS
ncbi:MAG: putative lipoprotein [Candidatus Midichloriaceae bacterium]|jgi:murein DD-endopeptidase MepM/ murein hydrolase activator NlpD|nr:putative lipoprotein [Candidatus Midichloriaceae bacterium]